MKTARWTIGAIVAGVALAASTTPAFAKTHKVLPGESIQAAIDAALPGDKVMVYPGTYQEMNANVAAVTIDKPLFLQGKVNKKLGEAGKVILMPYGTQQDGIRAEGSEGNLIDGVRIKGFSVQGFPNNGIHLRYTTNFRIENNESVNNLENGIFPTLSANGLVKKNVSYGSEDSALWVEASTNVRVLQNELHHSPTGLEVTVSQEISMEKNDIHDNTTGVGLYHANGSGLGIQPFGQSKNWYLTKNHIYNNNEPNTAPGGQAAALPPGGGVLVLGVDNVRIEDNLIENNHFYGVSIIDYCVAVAGSDRDCNLIPPLEDPTPDYDIVGDNDAIGNGTDPAKFCSNDGSQLCTMDMDCGLGNTCDDHPLAVYAADYTIVVVDPGENHHNKICGYGTSTFGYFGNNSGFYTVPKC